jgi:catechol 2,3-dioxygenase-like lactoylglutathione lyase family enzyme
MAPLNWHGQLSHLALSCEDVESTAAFYKRHFGMVEERGRDAVRLGWPGGQLVLQLRAGAATLDHYAFEVPDSDDLDRLLGRIAAAGVALEERADDDLLPPTVIHRLRDPEGRVIDLHGAIDRSAEHAADTRHRPIRLQHITLATDALPDLVGFYEEVLGFRVSDRMGERFVWLRCGVEHHTLAIVNAPSPTLLDHFSFDLGEWEDFKVWCDRFADAGTRTEWGPGRHGPGGNLFVMVDDPAGFHVELSAEMERYFDDRAEYPARTWAEVTETVNLWGSAPSWREPLHGAA